MCVKLEMMKKIRLILAFTTVLLFLATVTAPVRAIGQPCCYWPYWDNGNGCVQAFVLSTYIWPLPNRCDKSTEVCDLASQSCQGIGVVIGDTIDPTCPSGFTDITGPITTNPGTHWDFRNGHACCKMTLGLNPLDCLNSGNLTFGTNCPTTHHFDNSTGKCKRFVASKWDLIQDCGNKTVIDGLDHYDGVSTAIGCVPVENLTDFLKFLLKFALFASGGIIVLMIIATGYTVITSGGNPEKLQAAKENVIALFSGLALIAFSLILLYAIGADILGLPTFTP